MPSRDNHVMMKLKLGRWSQHRAPRGFEIESEIASVRHCENTQPKRRKRLFSLRNFKAIWPGWALGQKSAVARNLIAIPPSGFLRRNSSE